MSSVTLFYGWITFLGSLQVPEEMRLESPSALMFPTAHMVKRYLEDTFRHHDISQRSKGTLLIYGDPTTENR